MRKVASSLGVVFVAAAAGTVLVLAPMPAQDVAASPAAAPEAGYFLWLAGPVKGMRARTFTSEVVFFESTNWASLGARLGWWVAPGDTDLISVSFTAECNLFNRSGQDFVMIRVLDNGAPMEPSDGAQAFCSSPSTYSGAWNIRAASGSHNIDVQFLINDVPPLGNLAVSIDDFTLKLVAYE